jgi:hypothetical protein
MKKCVRDKRYRTAGESTTTHAARHRSILAAEQTDPVAVVHFVEQAKTFVYSVHHMNVKPDVHRVNAHNYLNSLLFFTSC